MIKREEFILSGSADQRINGDLTYDDQHKNQPTVLFVHGFKGFKDWGAHHLVAKEFAERGFRFIKFNLSHNGVTTENPKDVTDMNTFAANTVSMERKDLDTVVNYISHTYPMSDICLIGHSRGGGLVILQAANDPRISQLVTWSAISEFNSLWKPEQEEEWEKTGRIYVENARTKEKMPLDVTLLKDYRSHEEEFNIIRAANRVHIPWLILHGDQDVNVGFNIAQSLAQAKPEARLQKIENANHVYGASHPFNAEQLPAQLQDVCDKTLSFLKENLAHHHKEV